MVTIAQRGRPSAAHNMDWMSMGWPVIQLAKVGAASTALSFIANACRSLGGKNSSRSNTPSLRIGGWFTRASNVGRSMFSPAAQAEAMMLLSRMCSRLLNGSAEIPTTDSRLVTYPSISSVTTSWSSVCGACSEPRTLSGMPALLPGV